MYTNIFSFLQAAKEPSRNSVVRELSFSGINGVTFGCWHGNVNVVCKTNIITFRNWIAWLTLAGKIGANGWDLQHRFVSFTSDRNKIISLSIITNCLNAWYLFSHCSSWNSWITRNPGWRIYSERWIKITTDLYRGKTSFKELWTPVLITYFFLKQEHLYHSTNLIV